MRAKHLVEQPPSVLVSLQVIPPCCHRSWNTFVNESTCHCWPGTCFGQSEAFELVRFNKQLEYFCQWGYLPLLAGYLLWQFRKPFQLVRSNCNWVWFLESESELNFIFYQVLGFISIVQSELEPEPKYMSLREKLD